MKPETDANIEYLLQEWHALTDAIAALEYFAAVQSPDGDIKAFTDSLNAQRDACDRAIARYERLAREDKRKP